MKITDENYWTTFSRFDRPSQGDLVLLKEPSHYSKEELLVANRNFLSYNQASIPFIKYNGAYYKADLLEAVPNDLAGKVSSCRKYVLIKKLPENMDHSKCVYDFDEKSEKVVASSAYGKFDKPFKFYI